MSMCFPHLFLGYFHVHEEIPLESFNESYLNDSLGKMTYRRYRMVLNQGVVCSICKVACTKALRITVHTAPDKDVIQFFSEDMKKILTLGHVWPLSRGGINCNYNLRPLCQECNQLEKNDVAHIFADRTIFNSHLKGAIVKRRDGKSFARGIHTAAIINFKELSPNEFVFVLEKLPDMTFKPEDLIFTPNRKTF